MAHFTCEQCKRRIGSFSFRKELYVLQADDGDHNFCSEGCAELWRQARRAERIAEERAKPKPKSAKGNVDLTLLYARKVKECRDLYDAWVETSEAELLARAKELEKEIEELRPLLGIKTHQVDDDAPLEWERQEVEQEQQDDE